MYRTWIWKFLCFWKWQEQVLYSWIILKENVAHIVDKNSLYQQSWKHVLRPKYQEFKVGKLHRQWWIIYLDISFLIASFTNYYCSLPNFLKYYNWYDKKNDDGWNKLITEDIIFFYVPYATLIYINDDNKGIQLFSFFWRIRGLITALGMHIVKNKKRVITCSWKQCRQINPVVITGLMYEY